MDRPRFDTIATHEARKDFGQIKSWRTAVAEAKRHGRRVPEGTYVDGEWIVGVFPEGPLQRQHVSEYDAACGIGVTGLRSAREDSGNMGR